MSFEGTKERLVRELSEAQAATRAEFGMKDPAAKPRTTAPAPATGRRSTPVPTAS